MSYSGKLRNERTIGAGELGLSAVTLAAARTSSSFDVSGWSYLVLYVNFTYAAASDNTITIEFSPDKGTTWFMDQTIAVSSGTATLSDLTYSKTLSASDTYRVVLTLHSDDYARITIDGTSGGASDLVTVTAKLVN